MRPVFVGSPLGSRPGYQRLDQLTEVEQPLEPVPSGQQRSADHLGGVRAPTLQDERPAVAAATHVHVSERREPLDGLAHRGPADVQHRGEVALGRQPLAGHEFAESDRGDDPVRDVLARAPHAYRLEDGRTVGRGGREPTLCRLAGGHRSSPGVAYHAAMNRAIVRAPATMLARSTDSSVPWMFFADGP